MIRILLSLWLAFAPCSFALATSITTTGAGKPAVATPIGVPASVGVIGTVAHGGGTTQAITTSANVVAGDLVPVCVMLNTANDVVMSSMVDSAGNTYTKINAVRGAAAGFTELSMWYKANATAMASGGTITGTVTGATGGGYFVMAAARVTGIQTVPLDTNATNAASTVTTVTAATGVLAQSNELVMGCGGAINGGSAPIYSGAAGFTNITSTFSNITDMDTVQDRQIVAATTSINYAPTWTLAQARVLASVASFKGF